VRNTKFNKILGIILKRPHFATVPAFLLKFMLGERACLLLDSQKLIPQNLLAHGFQFQHPDLAQYLVEEI